jgi:protein SCO1/2
MEEPESPRHRPLEFVVWSGLVLVMLFVTVAYLKDVKERGARSRASLPAPVRMADYSEPEALPVIGELGEFVLTNESGAVFSRPDLAGRVWVVDIIFTRCPGPCATMTRRMAELQSAIAPGLPVGFLSLTTDPDFDTPAVLGVFGEQFGADFDRWHFLTGTKPELGRLAAEGLKLVGKEKAEELRSAPNDLFIHSTVFALVDSAGRLRGVKETLPPPASEDVRQPLIDPWETELKPEILSAIEQLLKEGGSR